MQEMKNKCTHKNACKESAIVFPVVKWRGIKPYKIYGMCMICGKTIAFTKEEYCKERGGKC